MNRGSELVVSSTDPKAIVAIEKFLEFPSRASRV
jgi:TusA-related sulfurtransferase